MSSVPASPAGGDPKLRLVVSDVLSEVVGESLLSQKIVVDDLAGKAVTSGVYRYLLQAPMSSAMNSMRGMDPVLSGLVRDTVGLAVAGSLVAYAQGKSPRVADELRMGVTGAVGSIVLEKIMPK